MHNGFLGTEKIFQKVELLVSMGSLTLNLVNPTQNKCKKKKKKSWTWWDLNPGQPLLGPKWATFTKGVDK